MTNSTDRLNPCPFCGCTMRIVSNRDTHKLRGDHDEDCFFADDEDQAEVYATDAGKHWVLTAWNRRHGASHD